MGTYAHTGVGNATARTMYASAGQVQDSVLTYLTSVAGTNAITASAPIVMTAYATGQTFQFIASASNTGATTININSIGLKSITRDGTTALVAGDLVSGGAYQVIYDGTQFQLTNSSNASVQVTSFSAGTTGLTPSTATTGAITLGGTLNVANGGTGLTTLATSRIPYGNGTGALSSSSTFVFDGTNLGIGTSSPADKLEVVSTAQYSGATIQGGTTTGAGILTLKNSNANGIWQFGVYGSGISGNANDLYIYDGVANAVRAVMDNSGNLGLGVTPSAWDTFKAFDINTYASLFASTGSAQLSGNLYYASSAYKYKTTSAASLYVQTSGQHQWYNAPSGTANATATITQAMTLDASSNLAVTGSISSNGALVSKVGTADGQVNLGSDNNTYVYSASTDLRLWTRNARPVTIYTNDAERMRIDASGNLLVGKTVSDNTTAGVKLQPSGTGVFVASSDVAALFNRLSTTGSILEFRKDGTTVGSVSVTASATAYNTSSDYRLKENIEPMTGALDAVAQLKPVTYNWKADGSDGQGFIAHELAEVVPDCVVGEKDATKEEEYEVTPAVMDENGKEVTPAVMGTRTVPVYQGIDTSFLVATLTAAIQEQQAMINELKAKVAALEAK
jgi:hypothetical protein